MNIVIFETEHFETAFTVIRLFDLPGNKITIYTSKEAFTRLNDLLLDNTHRFNWEILPRSNRFRLFNLLHYELKKQDPDILWLNTVTSNHLLWALISRLLHFKKIILTVHDINCLFESRFRFSFRHAIVHWGKKWLIERVNEFNVISDTMVSYLGKHVKEKKIYNIPGAVFPGSSVRQSLAGQLQIVVPGSIDPKRRNYEQVFELATMADKEKMALQIVLLGGYSSDYGKTIVERAKQFGSEFCQILAYHTKIVDQVEFDKQIEAAHFVFIPSVIHTKICGEIPEEYGKTKSSGNIFDVVKHAKPFLAPGALTIPANLQTSCFRYNSPADILNFFKKLISEPRNYDQWQKNAVTNSHQYTIEKVRERNLDLFKPPVSG
jgi:glycosyl transferase family 4